MTSHSDRQTAFERLMQAIEELKEEVEEAMNPRKDLRIDIHSQVLKLNYHLQTDIHSDGLIDDRQTEFVCLCVCVCERERGRGRETDRQREGGRQTDIDRHTLLFCLVSSSLPFPSLLFFLPFRQSAL